MKSKITILATTIISMLLITACRKEQKEILMIPSIPEGYSVDKSLYLSEGDGIYAFIEDKSLDYEKIGAEICNGNAKSVQSQFEKSDVSKKNLKEYAAVQNILGITEVYLGNYDQAYGYFYDTINYIDKKSFSEKDKILTVLYNNAGAVTIDLHKNATNDKRLNKAAKLCQEPYMGLVIASNQTGRLKADAPTQDYGKMIVQAKELIEKENQIAGSPDYVLFSAVKYMSAGYVFTGQREQAVNVLNQYIPLIPHTPEYNLVRASLTSYRGYCYDGLEDYEHAIDDFQNAIALARKTVDENSRQLALTYNQLGLSYSNLGDWDTGLVYFEKAIPGYRYSVAGEKGILYWNVGNASWRLDQYDKAKKYLLKSHVNEQKVIKSLGGGAGIKEDQEVKEILLELYKMDSNTNLSFSQWLKKESKPYIAEENEYSKYP